MFETLVNEVQYLTVKGERMKIASITTGFADIPGQVSMDIFAQGCKLRCKGCQNPGLLDFDGGEDLSLEDMGTMLNARPMTEWICWLGGDAVYQPEELLAFNSFFKSKGLMIALYTGKYFKEIQDLIGDIDLVIDGPWDESSGTVGDDTTNQNVWHKKGESWQQVKFTELEKILENA